MPHSTTKSEGTSALLLKTPEELRDACGCRHMALLCLQREISILILAGQLSSYRHHSSHEHLFAAQFLFYLPLHSWKSRDTKKDP